MSNEKEIYQEEKTATGRMKYSQGSAEVEKKFDPTPGAINYVKEGPRAPSPEETAYYKKLERQRWLGGVVPSLVQGIMANHHYMQNNCKDPQTTLVSPTGIVKHAIDLADIISKEIEK